MRSKKQSEEVDTDDSQGEITPSNSGQLNEPNMAEIQLIVSRRVEKSISNIATHAARTAVKATTSSTKVR